MIGQCRERHFPVFVAYPIEKPRIVEGKFFDFASLSFEFPSSFFGFPSLGLENASSSSLVAALGKARGDSASSRQALAARDSFGYNRSALRQPE